MQIALKRIYEDPSRDDGVRILVERLWPRGVSKEQAALDFWSKDTAPSHDLRTWFDHTPSKWTVFQRRYERELNANSEAVAQLLNEIGTQKTTFVYASRNEQMNNAVALRDYLMRKATS